MAWGRIAVILLFITLIFDSSIAMAGQRFSESLCDYPGFYCKRVRHGSWSSLFPDEHDRSIVMRINRMNTQIWQGMVVAIPKHLQEADIMDFAPFPKQLGETGEKVVVVDPSVHAWGAYDMEGSLVRWGPASSGADWCKDIDEECHTHAGTYRIFSLGSSDCISHKFPLPNGGAPMPYCMYFNNGQALHGEPNGLPGYNASHGCVRLYVNDAEWLRYDFVEGPTANNNYRGTRVVVREY